ncbi:hypothetical protein [Streptomyces sp. NBC_00029]|uniref:hypothetical protein n=1 Tax=Streptomyces sp. NBC_00029 TaxID=2903613 RepID=UPI0038642E41
MVQAKEKVAEIKEQAAEKATHVTGRLREKVGQAAQLVKDKTPDPALDKAAHAAVQVRKAATQAGRLAAEKTPDRAARRPRPWRGANRTPADRRGCRARRIPASAPQLEAPVKAAEIAYKPVARLNPPTAAPVQR